MGTYKIDSKRVLYNMIFGEFIASRILETLPPSVEELQNRYDFTYYSTMGKAVTDVNNGTTANGDASKDSAVAGVYTDENGGKNVVLLKDYTEPANIKPTVDMTINLGGHTLSSNTAPGIDIVSGNVIIDGRLRGSAFNVYHPTNPMVAIRAQSNGSVMVNGGSYTCTSESGERMACVLLNTGTATVRNCNMVSVSSSATAYTIQNGVGATLDISNCDVIANSTNGEALSLMNKGTATVRNCNIQSANTDGPSYGVFNEGVATISGCNIRAYSNYSHDGENYTAVSNGVYNQSPYSLTINDCYVMGTHSGVQNFGALYVNGGTYEGYGHGGFYFSGDNTTSYVRDAVSRDCEMPDGYTATHGKNGAGFYVGDATKVNVYMDSCDIYGVSASQIAVIKTNNNALYISNSTINNKNGGDANIRIDEGNTLYIGRGNNFTAEDTNRPEAVVVTDEVYVQGVA